MFTDFGERGRGRERERNADRLPLVCSLTRDQPQPSAQQDDATAACAAQPGPENICVKKQMLCYHSNEEKLRFFQTTISM